MNNGEEGSPSISVSPPKVFISHSSQDRAFVEKLAGDLKISGVQIWMSGYDILPGDQFPQKINEGLEWCEFFIIVLSKSSLSRPWVQTELYASVVRKNKGNIRKIIPVKIEESCDLPALFASLHVQDFLGQEYRDALAHVLDSISKDDVPLPVSASRELEVNSPVIISQPSLSVFGVGQSHWMWFWLGIVVLTLVAYSLARTPAAEAKGILVNLLSGSLLAGVTFGFFGSVDAILTNDYKFEIAVWLVGLDAGKYFEDWPGTFTKIFDRVFGTKHLSWKCFGRSCLVSSTLACITYTISLLLFIKPPLPPGTVVPPTDWGHPPSRNEVVAVLLPVLIILGVLGNILPDYLSLLETRFALRIMRKHNSPLLWCVVIVSDIAFTFVIAAVVSFVMTVIGTSGYYQDVMGNIVLGGPGFGGPTYLTPGEARFDFILKAFPLLWFFPIFFTSIWLWLYAGSGFLLKAAQRFDIGFQWFNRHFDIERRPLQSIGLVASIIVAMVYWTVVLVHWV
jgi:hypothetical protein